MPADLTSMDAALKETWTESRLAEQLYQDNPFLDKIKKLKSTQVGQQAVTPIHTGRNFGYTALPAGGGALNAAGQQELAQATWQYTHHNQQVKIQGSAIDGTKGDALSVAQVVDMEVTGALNDLNRQLTRQLFWTATASSSSAAGVTTASTTVAAGPGVRLQRDRARLARGRRGRRPRHGGQPVVAMAAASRSRPWSSPPTAPTITISGSAVTTSASTLVSFKGPRRHHGRVAGDERPRQHRVGRRPPSAG
jgi:hypothetical protein